MYIKGKEIKRSAPMIEIKAKMDNPLSELISDNIYDLLSSHGLIDEKSVRDFQIRKKFKQLRATKVSAGDAIEAIKEHYPYLQFDTLRKIVYQIIIPTVKENTKA
jgi:hypothetical protein